MVFESYEYIGKVDLVGCKVIVVMCDFESGSVEW